MAPTDWGVLGAASLLFGGLVAVRVLTDQRRPVPQRRYREARDRSWPLLLAGLFGLLGIVWLARALLG